jgi:integrase
MDVCLRLWSFNKAADFWGFPSTVVLARRCSTATIESVHMGDHVGRSVRRRIPVVQIIGRLSAVSVGKKTPGYYADGANLYLRVAPKGAGRGWIFRYTIGGKTRDMGLGSFPAISLAAARELAAECRKQIQQGIDPIERRRAERAGQRVAAAKTLTFDACALQYVKEHEAGWRNAKHRAQWTSSLSCYVSPVFGKLPVAAIDVGMVLRALKPIWNTKAETAVRVRGRIEAVLDWAAVHGYRGRENPARWKGNLEGALPNRAGKRLVEHLAALPYLEIAAFMAALRERNERTAPALEFTILTAARSGETLGATWDEFDLENKIWKIPAARMKGGREHRIPLSAPAVAVLERMLALRDGKFVFTSLIGQPLTRMTPLLQRMGRDDLTVHGFRSTFRDWAAERTNFPREVVEMALAHRVGTQVELAYRRSDLFEKRRRLMDDWARYCANSASGEVVPLRRREARP